MQPSRITKYNYLNKDDLTGKKIFGDIAACLHQGVVWI
jgi:hypothetical protein